MQVRRGATKASKKATLCCHTYARKDFQLLLSQAKQKKDRTLYSKKTGENAYVMDLPKLISFFFPEEIC